MERGGPMMPYYPPPAPIPVPMPMPCPVMHHHGCMVDVHELMKAYRRSKKTTRMLKHMLEGCHSCAPPCPPDPCGCGCDPCMGLCTNSNFTEK
ncbi:hypothetical protein SAMN05444487_1066 [Marininema mesophilum]|uniref:Uncharacterized protein n=1 Tax=Marininema mesophilum TaxID=1048340 RepID=A0A1H2W3B4_9BACL|nr:hypothetical protein SAMN05444487_1066 [Marininema mesophilum]